MTEVGLHFYAAASIATPDGYHIGTFSIMAGEPRSFSEVDVEPLVTLAEAGINEVKIPPSPPGPKYQSPSINMASNSPVTCPPDVSIPPDRRRTTPQTSLHHLHGYTSILKILNDFLRHLIIRNNVIHCIHRTDAT